MNSSNPQTLDEWRDYIASLSGSDLRSKAKAANSVQFVRMLEAEGADAELIGSLFEMFANQFVEDGQEPPGRYDGAYLDLASLVKDQPVAD